MNFNPDLLENFENIDVEEVSESRETLPNHGSDILRNIEEMNDKDFKARFRMRKSIFDLLFDEVRIFF